MTGATVTGKRQHRHARLFSGDGAPGFGTGKRDIRQLRRRRLWHHAAIGKAQRRAAVLWQHQENGRERFTAWLQADNA